MILTTIITQTADNAHKRKSHRIPCYIIQQPAIGFFRAKKQLSSESFKRSVLIFRQPGGFREKGDWTPSGIAV